MTSGVSPRRRPMSPMWVVAMVAAMSILFAVLHVAGELGFSKHLRGSTAAGLAMDVLTAIIAMAYLVVYGMKRRVAWHTGVGLLLVTMAGLGIQFVEGQRSLVSVFDWLIVGILAFLTVWVIMYRTASEWRLSGDEASGDVGVDKKQT